MNAPCCILAERLILKMTLYLQGRVTGALQELDGMSSSLIELNVLLFLGSIA